MRGDNSSTLKERGKEGSGGGGVVLRMTGSGIKKTHFEKAANEVKESK